MDTNSSHKHFYFKLFLSTAALAGMILAESGNAVVKADKVTVQPGDNLITFAQKYNTSVDRLASKNQISDPNHIEVGQSIETGDDQAVTTVIVKAGDTVSSLANQYNTTIQRIAQDNNLDENYTIIVGQKLKITTNDMTIPVTQQSRQDVPAPQQSVLAQATTPAIANNNQAVPNTTPTTNTNATQSTPASNNSQGYVSSSSVSGNEASAKAWIAGRESGGNYSARNGQYIGKYQLSSAYLGGDYSPAHQEQVADQYVQGRYGSWTAAQQFWQANGWY